MQVGNVSRGMENSKKIKGKAGNQKHCNKNEEYF